MEFDSANLVPVFPEIFLLAAASVVLVVDLFVRDPRRVATYALTLLSLVGTLAVLGMTGADGAELHIFDGNVVRDPLADALKASILVISLAVFVYGYDYLNTHKLMRGEFFTLGLFAVLGMMVMVSADSFLSVYLGLELLALCQYALVAFDRDSATDYSGFGLSSSSSSLSRMSSILSSTFSLTSPATSLVLSQVFSATSFVLSQAFSAKSPAFSAASLSLALLNQALSLSQKVGLVSAPSVMSRSLDRCVPSA